ncbi:hypothetical protein AAVH_27002 [Aphelenchoides avenae]|nr:hypothetical protein AAVH_27002 [Aphelenchus avenae]
MDYFRKFFDTLEGFARNETTVKSWLLRANLFDDGQRIYIDQLKALVQDMSMMLDKVVHSRLMNGRDDDIRALAWRMGLLDASLAYRALVHRNGGGVAEFQDIAKFGYLFAAHIEELLDELSVANGRRLEEPIALLVNTVSVRKWVGKRWARLGEKPAVPMLLEIVVDEMVR